MDWDSFFILHDGLLRQGPGTAEDVAWAVSLAQLKTGARICDAGCGTGADLEALSRAAPDAQILGIEKRHSFVEMALPRFAGSANISVTEGDLAALPGPFDMIWCAGALYFLGLEGGLQTMRGVLAKGGVLAFSEPAFFSDSPSDAARAFWEGYETRPDAEIGAAVEQAGFEILGQRRVSDAGWHAYFEPLKTRAAELRPNADEKLVEILEYCTAEAEAWSAVRDQTGYLLTVARAL